MWSTHWILALTALTAALTEARLDRRHIHHRRAAKDQVHVGLAYWGKQDGKEGACGQVHKDSESLIGISVELFKEASCDKWVQILNGANNKTIVLPVKDSCDGCAKNDVYLSVGAFEKLADLDTGVIQVAWTFVKKPAKESAKPTTSTFTNKKVLKPDTSCDRDEPAVKTPEAKAEEPEAAPRKQVADKPKTEDKPKVEEKPKVEDKPKKEVAPVADVPEVKVEPKVEVKTPEKKKPAAAPAKDTSGFQLGLAWAVDNRYATEFAGSDVKFFHHWRDGDVPELSDAGIDFYPTLYDRSQAGTFASQVAAMGGKPKVILGHNEPELQAQGFSTVANAVQDYRQYMNHLASKDTILAAPSICYDLEGWLKPFMEQCTGCPIGALSIHSYDDYDPEAKAYKARVQKVHEAFPDLPIYVTEVGLTSASNPSEAQAKQYLSEIINWSRQTGYVKKFAWFGAWLDNPDGFAATNGRFYSAPFTLSGLGQFYAHAD